MSKTYRELQITVRDTTKESKAFWELLVAVTQGFRKVYPMADIYMQDQIKDEGEK